MLVKMKITKKGSPNGIVVNEYVKGDEYDLPESLTKTFLKLGVCEMVKVPENKDAGKSPKNKEKGEKPAKTRGNKKEED